jgi:hypothetical protein
MDGYVGSHSSAWHIYSRQTDPPIANKGRFAAGVGLPSFPGADNVTFPSYLQMSCATMEILDVSLRCANSENRKSVRNRRST